MRNAQCSLLSVSFFRVASWQWNLEAPLGRMWSTSKRQTSRFGSRHPPGDYIILVEVSKLQTTWRASFLCFVFRLPHTLTYLFPFQWPQTLRLRWWDMGVQARQRVSAPSSHRRDFSGYQCNSGLHVVLVWATKAKLASAQRLSPVIDQVVMFYCSAESCVALSTSSSVVPLRPEELERCWQSMFEGWAAVLILAVERICRCVKEQETLPNWEWRNLFRRAQFKTHSSERYIRCVLKK